MKLIRPLGTHALGTGDFMHTSLAVDVCILYYSSIYEREPATESRTHVLIRVQRARVVNDVCGSDKNSLFDIPTYEKKIRTR